MLAGGFSLGELRDGGYPLLLLAQSGLRDFGDWGITAKQLQEAGVDVGTMLSLGYRLPDLCDDKSSWDGSSVPWYFGTDAIAAFKAAGYTAYDLMHAGYAADHLPTQYYPDTILCGRSRTLGTVSRGWAGVARRADAPTE